MADKYTITLKDKDPKKRCNRWNADADITNPLIQNIYVNHPFLQDAAEIRVTIEKVK